MWKTLHQGNAIEAAAVTVRFAEPLGAMLTKKTIKAIESDAFRQGFIETQPLQHFQFQLGPQSSKLLQAPAPAGMAFLHNSVQRLPTGDVAQLLSRQLIIQPEQFVLQVHTYRGWQAEWNNAGKPLFGRLLDIASAGVPVGAIRLEYMNRFVWENSERSHDLEAVLKRSDLISSHVFEAPDFWHSHTGRFDKLTDNHRRLVQVNADYQVVSNAIAPDGMKAVGLMIAVERQFLNGGIDLGETGVDGFLGEPFEELHNDVHYLFKQLINTDFARVNGLPHDQ